MRGQARSVAALRALGMLQLDESGAAARLKHLQAGAVRYTAAVRVRLARQLTKQRVGVGRAVVHTQE
eukprot:6931842-Prymnesium_polylepis.1